MKISKKRLAIAMHSTLINQSWLSEKVHFYVIGSILFNLNHIFWGTELTRIRSQNSNEGN